ncbi:PAS domain-containing protein [Alienimonas chondri]|uniref:histidine kinase n=1 Tax=Alienimonas chondri TaxID=2681879 RepID=A0ABX1VJ01_9PLAN|nr:PAS domain-containing protein [Alienimonas chondri]NNJ27742.1 hypothetical protein [Alienimonas chondri]
MPSTFEASRSEMDYSALDIAIEDAASDVGLPFQPGPPPPALRASTLLGVAVLDRRLRYRRIDAMLAAMNGRTVADFLGRTLAEVVPDLADVVGAAQRRVLETGEPLMSIPVSGTAREAPAGRRWLASYFPLPPSAESLKDGRSDAAGVIAVVREVDEELVLRPRGVSDEQFRELVTRSTVGIAQVDRKGTFLYVNDRYCAMTGWSRDELVGVRRHRDITHPHDVDRRDSLFARALETGEPFLSDKRLRRPDGRSVWVRNTVTVLTGADGQTESLFAVAVDMTDRIRTHRALTRSERRLRLAAEAGGMGVWSFDLKKGLVDWSSEAVAMYGGGFESKPSREQLRERIHPDDLPLLDEVQPMPAGGGPARLDVTHRVIHPPRPGESEGETRWVRALGERWFDSRGRLQRSTGVLRDVTAERAAADKLAASERRLRLAINAADLGTWEFDAATGLSDWDARTADLFGVGEAFRAGKRLYTQPEMLAAIHPDDRDRIAAEIPKTLDPAGSGKYDVDHRVVWPDGTVRLLSVSGEATFEGTGPPGSPDARHAVRVTGTVKDVTARRARQRLLAETEERRRLAAEAADLGAFDFTLQTGRVWWDDRCRAIFGGSLPDVLNVETIFERIHPDDRENVRALVEAACDPDGEPRYQAEYRVVDPPAPGEREGAVRWVRAHGEARFERPGEPATRLVGCVRDVTEDREQEDRLRLSEERQRLAAGAAELGAYSFDLRDQIVWWDERARELFGVAGEQLTLEDAIAPLHPDDRPRMRDAIAAAADPAGDGRFLLEYRIVKPDGSHRWLRSMATMQFLPDRTHEAGRTATKLIGYLQDVTDARRHEQTLTEQNERLEAEVARRTGQLRTAAERLAEAGRQERDRIAHVLHDHLQQILVGAKMNLSVLEASCEGQNGELAARVAELIDEAISESRSLSAELAPPILRKAGLGPALGWLAGQFRTRHGLNVLVNSDDEASAELDESLAALLFGAARESLLNIIKHAKAQSARLTFERCVCGSEFGPPLCGRNGGGRNGDPGVRLTITDDGIGFDAPSDGAWADGARKDGFGMSDLRQRVDLLGGVVTVVSAPEAGCTVEICVPLPNRADSPTDSPPQ